MFLSCPPLSHMPPGGRGPSFFLLWIHKGLVTSEVSCLLPSCPQVKCRSDPWEQGGALYFCNPRKHTVCQGKTRTFLTGASAEKILPLPLFEEYTSHFIWGKRQGSHCPQVEPVCCGCPASGVSLPFAITRQFATNQYQFSFLQSKDVDRGGQRGTS